LSSRLDDLGRAATFGSAAHRTEIAEQLKLMLGDTTWFDLGVWTGAAQLAARSGQDAFFAADGAAMSQFTQLSGRTFEPAEQWAQVLQPVRALAAGEWRASGSREALLAIITHILRAAGG
jgi:hypothetical protein